MLNNAKLCRLPLLPNNIPITDSGFENVNAFNAVTPRSRQPKLTWAEWRGGVVKGAGRE